MNPKISLIIPVYNVEKYIKKCLDSAINQTLRDIEIIIVNDGSTDNSLKICQEYANKDERIILIDQINSGLGISRNNAIKIANGEFLCFLDSDDTLDLLTLENCYKKAIQESSEIVVFGFERIDENTSNVMQVRDDFDFNFNLDKKDFFRKVIRAEFKLMACAMIVKRYLFVENCLKFPSALHEDLYVTPQLFYHAKKVSFLKENYYKWLIRIGSITNHIKEKHIDGIITAIFYIKIFLLKENIYNEYKDDFLLFKLVYLSLLHRRIKTFVKDSNEKKELFEILAKKSFAVISMEKLSKYTLDNRFKELIQLLNLYNQGQNKKDDSLRSELALCQSSLNEIKSSRGYKFLLKYYYVRDRFLPYGSKRRLLLKSFADLLMKKDFSVLKKKPITVENNKNNQLKYNVVFLPHKDYHVWSMGLIARELKELGISSCLMDLTDYYRDEGSRKEAKKFSDIEFLDLSYILDNRIDYDGMICMNDWDPKVTKPLIVEAKKNGKATIGIIEGINDFLDADVKWKRNAYKTVEYLFMTGEHDKQFFKEKKEKSFVVGVPRLEELMKEKPVFPKKPLAVINLNFSYGVLEDKREIWLKSVIEGCEKANVDYVITQHPADKADLSGYNVSQKNMYDTIRDGSIVISRFGSIIIEALAMGKPAIYHNPHGEKVIKFQEPMEAYSLSFDSDSLAEAIKYELSLKDLGVDYRKRANKFLDFHANINAKETPVKLSVKYIKRLLEQ